MSRHLTPLQIKAELEAGATLFVGTGDYGYCSNISEAAIITRIEFFGTSLLGFLANSARVFILEDEATGETWYTLDVARRLRTYVKTDFDNDED